MLSKEPQDVLVVDADAARAEALRHLLDAGGFAVRVRTPTAELVERIAARPPGMVLLQAGSADADSLATLRALKGGPATAAVHVIVLGDGRSGGQAVAALEAGADDYVSQPFAGRELLARVRSCLSRPAAQLVVQRLTAGRLVLDPARHQLLIDDDPVDLSRSMYRLVEFLMTNRDVVQ
ncbi:MAG: response regulator transcription factor, partial [Pseudomonadota bacterium]